MTTLRPHLARAVLGLVFSIVAAPAFADDAKTPPSASVEKREEARARFARGVELYDEGDYKLALIEFERAYAAAPSYRMLYNIGQVHQQLGHYAKALRALERYLQEGADRVPADRRDDVERDMASLRARTAALTVRVSVEGAEIELDQEPLGRSPAPAQLVDAGEHRLRVTKAGFAPQERAIVLAGSDVSTVEVGLIPLETPQVPPPPRDSRSEVWILWTATGALAAGSAVCGVVALNHAADLKNLRDTAGTSEADRKSASDRARSFSIAADALGVGAVVAGGVGLFLTLRRPSSTALRMSVGAGSVRLTGEF